MERFYPWIFRRKSFHLFRNLQDFEISDVEICEIIEFHHLLEPLVAGIHTKICILPSSQVDCRRGQEYCILFYSEKKDNYLANIGWLGQQLDLFLVSKGIGALLRTIIGSIWESFSYSLSFAFVMRQFPTAVNYSQIPEMIKKKL